MGGIRPAMGSDPLMQIKTAMHLRLLTLSPA
jgi:hypothetical protein